MMIKMIIKQYALIIALVATNLEATDYTAPGTAHPSPGASLPHLNYYGGPVISNVKIVNVLWGPKVNAQVKQAMPAFLKDLVSSLWIDWLCEYNTVGKKPTTTNQTIGRGSFVGQKMITPFNQSTSLADQDIQTELTQQLDAGNLPKPAYDAHGYLETVYVIEFPPGITISLDGSLSCQAGGFCAYHSALNYKGKPIMYAVQPDFGPGSGCDVGCGSGTMLQNQESVHSHEIAESITDPEISFSQTLAPPIGWYDPNNGEIGDICNGEQSPLTVNGKKYTVQKLWSNSRKACIATNPKLPKAPTITGTKTVKAGKGISLQARGGSAPFQWYHNNVLIPSAKANKFAVARASKRDAGMYVVRSSCSNVSSTFKVVVV